PSIREMRRIPRPTDGRVLAFTEQLAGAAGPGCEHRYPRRAGLEHRQAERLLSERREQEDAGLVVRFAPDAMAGQGAGEGDGGGELLAFRPGTERAGVGCRVVADDAERRLVSPRPQQPDRLQRDVEPLVFLELSDEQPM